MKSVFILTWTPSLQHNGMDKPAWQNTRPVWNKKGSPERGKMWDAIAAKLNSLLHPKFIVNKRSLRDSLNILMAKFKAKNREEERAMGPSEKRETWWSKFNEKRRKSTGDAIGFLEKKSEQGMALRREETEVRKQEEMRGSQQTLMQQEILRIIQQQQEDQLKQQQRNQAQQLQFMQSMLNQQQEQSQALLSLIERLASK